MLQSIARGRVKTPEEILGVSGIVSFVEENYPMTYVKEMAIQAKMQSTVLFADWMEIVLGGINESDFDRHQGLIYNEFALLLRGEPPYNNQGTVERLFGVGPDLRVFTYRPSWIVASIGSFTDDDDPRYLKLLSEQEEATKRAVGSIGGILEQFHDNGIEVTQDHVRNFLVALEQRVVQAFQS